MERTIRVTCDTKLHIPISELHEIQGGLKEMTKDNFVKLRKSIVTDGFNFPVFVWGEKLPTSAMKWWILDGHGRRSVVSHLISEEGFHCPSLPCVEVEASDLAAAKRKVLAISSQFNTMTNEGLHQFMSDIDLGVEQLGDYQFDAIDVPAFRMEYYDEPAAQESDPTEKKTVSFDAYKNAAVKQVVLYYAKEEYEQIIRGLDALMAKWGLEEYSQVVWRMASEANRS